MRTPLQILTSISTATFAFALPLGLATFAPDQPQEPRIETPSPSPELRFTLEEPEANSPPERPTARGLPESNATRPPLSEPRPEEAARRARQASAHPLSRTPTTGRAFARLRVDYHVRPDHSMASSMPRAKSPSKRRRACLEPVEGIVETGTWSYDVQRELVSSYTHNLRQASRLAATSWHRTQGQVDGFRVKRVRCGSPLHQLGFRNGDVILSVNGRPVTSTVQALSAFRRLRRNDVLTVKVTGWKGQRKTLRFRLI